MTRRLAEHHRVIVLGGLAVISHGHPRPTHDADVWLDPTLDDGARVMEVIDLLVTKQLTGREKDLQDIAFLEAKAEREYLDRLPAASETEALAMLDRFLTPRVAEAAFAHPAPSVREAARTFLREMTEAGDPFARDILRAIESKP